MDKKTEKVMNTVRKNRTMTGQPRNPIETSELETKNVASNEKPKSDHLQIPYQKL
jgi:hypothetical protein